MVAVTQTSLGDFESLRGGLDELTNAEREAYLAVRQGNTGVREYARKTDRSYGTVGNLLARADAKIGGDST